MGTLYIVATPIGNLEDVTLRSLRILREVDSVFAEDTRRTRVLLDHFEIAQRPISLHAHNEAARIEEVIAVLESDCDVALVSDAGTPLVSDPGARLVSAVAAAGHRVEAIPGASALLGALTVAGLDTERVLFLGFLPRKAGARRRLLESQRGRPETIVLFESPRRVAETLREIVEILGDRRACLARELTKKHEEILRDEASVLAAACLDTPPRGECTLVIGGAGADEIEEVSTWDDRKLGDAIGAELALGSSTRDLARDLAGQSGRTRSDVYAMAVRMREQGDTVEASDRAADDAGERE
ncbi:MAG TPA: 16S rRNA (cytidine(1402)-2'-O)-methyltransferase [Myxococcales bacterium]|nr:16S rRNA (cytidine(1402)-2'-O)-methyltransferase [Myxococcales bacterium]HIK86637.1 16S rRNA (cytidine(1402)-2'-O)-methyltransferase [Myxococcales bacterium]